MTETCDGEDELNRKNAEQTAQRVLALLAVIGKVHEPDRSIAWSEKHNIQQFLSPSETTFIHDESASEESRVAFSWRAEALVSLIWALGGISEMPPFGDQFDVFEIAMIRSALDDPHGFVSNARLRAPAEIDDMEGHLYHQHWRVRDAELVGIGKLLDPSPDDPPIEDLNPGIVYERRYALSWLVGWGDDWDDVPTDT